MALRRVATERPDRVGLWTGYNDPIAHQIDAQKQAVAAHIADQRKARRQFIQARLEVVAGEPRALLQAFVLQHIQHRHADRAGHRISAEGGEEFHAVGKGACDLGRGHHRRHRMTIADRLA